MELITSKDNAYVKRVAKLISSRRERDETGFFVCEGVRLCMDGIKSGYMPTELYITKAALQKYPELGLVASQCPKTALITDSMAARISDTGSPQGVFGVFARRDTLDNAKSAVKIKNGGKYVLLASLQDPGNVGAIMRSCEAFGMDGLLLSADCPDIRGPKVLRASMGGVFRLPVKVCGEIGAEIAALKQAGVKVYAAAAGGLPADKADFSGSCAVVIGNEGNGLDEKIIALCGQTVGIPMPGGAESLNAGVAAGILMWEMTRGAAK